MTLVVFGSVLLALDRSLPPDAGRILESAVGLMLVVLGVDVLRRWHRKRIHLHAHRHEDGIGHLHAHAHEESAPHDPAHHEHDHVSGPLPRALMVGSVHGMAGTAALTLLSLQTLLNPRRLGVRLPSHVRRRLDPRNGALFDGDLVAASVPARHLIWASNGLQAALGVVTLLLGCWIVAQAAFLGATAGIGRQADHRSHGREAKPRPDLAEPRIPGYAGGSNGSFRALTCSASITSATRPSAPATETPFPCTARDLVHHHEIGIRPSLDDAATDHRLLVGIAEADDREGDARVATRVLGLDRRLAGADEDAVAFAADPDRVDLRCAALSEGRQVGEVSVRREVPSIHRAVG